MQENIQTKSTKATNATITIIFMIFMISFVSFQNLYFEKIERHHGLGWDGGGYGELAQDPIKAIQSGKLGIEKIERIVPCLIVHFGLNLIGIEASFPNIIQAFSWMNLVYLAISIFLFYLIFSERNLSGRIYLILLSGTFINVFFLKTMAFYPVLTDMFSFMVAELVLLLWIRNRIIFIFILFPILFFTHTLIALLSALMVSFPVKRNSLNEKISSSRFFIQVFELAGKYAWMGLLLVPFTLAIQTAYLLTITPFPNHVGYASPQTIIDMFFFGILFCILAFLIFFKFAKQVNFGLHFRAFAPFNFFVISILFLTFHFTTAGMIKVSEPIGFFTIMILSNSFLPFKFLVSHLIYFGPFFFFFIIPFKKMFRAADKVPGSIFFIILTWFVLLDCESRHAMFLFPVLIYFSADALNRNLKPGYVSVFLFLFFSIMFTKFYLTFKPVDGPYFLSDQGQKYFMNQGPYIDFKYFIIQASALLVVFFVLWATRFFRINPTLVKEEFNRDSVN